MPDTDEIAVEVLPSRDSYLSNRWPIQVAPERDELLSSWLHRIAFAHGLSVKRFGHALGLEEQSWSAHSSNVAQRYLIKLLQEHTGLSVFRITAMTIGFENWQSVALTMRWSVTSRNKGTWLQFCPHCLCEDETPYFRRQWRRSTSVMCPTHNRGLLDRCPQCKSGIVPSDHKTVLPPHICAECSFDLRKAKGPLLSSPTRISSDLVDTLVTMESVRGRSLRSSLPSLIQALPSLQKRASEANFSSLSTTARLRCLSTLNVSLRSYLARDPDPSIAARRRAVIATIDPIRPRGTLQKRRTKSLTRSPQTKRSQLTGDSAKQIDLATLISAYRDLANRGKARI